MRLLCLSTSTLTLTKNFYNVSKKICLKYLNVPDFLGITSEDLTPGNTIIGTRTATYLSIGTMVIELEVAAN